MSLGLLITISFLVQSTISSSVETRDVDRGGADGATVLLFLRGSEGSSAAVDLIAVSWADITRPVLVSGVSKPDSKVISLAQDMGSGTRYILSEF